MASSNSNHNPFKKDDRVKVVDESDSLFFGKKGTVVYTFEASTEVKLDSGSTVVMNFNRFAKVPKKTKKKKVKR